MQTGPIRREGIVDIDRVVGRALKGERVRDRTACKRSCGEHLPVTDCPHTARSFVPWRVVTGLRRARGTSGSGSVTGTVDDALLRQ